MQKQELYIIKIGGNVIDHPEKLEAFLKDFLKFKTENSSSRWWKIGNKLAEKLEIPQEFLKAEELPIRRPEMLQ